jgi:hypothetical protein
VDASARVDRPGDGDAETAAPGGDDSGQVEKTARQVTDSPASGTLIAIGLVVYGGVHLVLAWLFLQVGWAESGRRPITAMSQTVLGQVVLWAAAAGMAVLVLWRIAQALLRSDGTSRWHRAVATATRLFEATVYALICTSAVQAAVTRGRKGSVQGEGRSEQSLGAVLLAHGWGRVSVMAIAVALLALGVELFRSAVTRSFAEDLDDSAPRVVLWAGVVGTGVKAVAVVIISGLLAWSAITDDPSKTGGIEAMIQTLRSQPFGPALLTLLGAGLASFGLYCFGWAAHVRR